MTELSLVADRESLLSALSKASMVGATNALFMANGSLEVHAIGNHASMLARPTVDVDKPGAAALVVAPLESLVRSASDEKIRIDQKATQLRVRGARFDHVFATHDPEKAPRFCESQWPASLSSDPAIVGLALRRILFACNESSRYALGSIAMQSDGAGALVDFVAFDGSKLGVESVAIKGWVKSNCLVPRKSAIALRSLLVGAKSLELCFSDNWIGANIDGSLFQFQQCEGRFPPWKNGLDSLEKKSKFQISAGPLQHAIAQSAIALDGSVDTRRMDFVGHGGTLTLSCRSTSINGGVELPIEDCDFKASYDFRYVLDAIKAFNPEQSLTLCVCGGGELLISDDAGFVGLIAGLSDKD